MLEQSTARRCSMSLRSSELKRTRGLKVAEVRLNTLDRGALIRACPQRTLQQLAFAGGGEEILVSAQEMAREELERRQEG
jgi:hypothetical protein